MGPGVHGSLGMYPRRWRGLLGHRYSEKIHGAEDNPNCFNTVHQQKATRSWVGGENIGITWSFFF